MKKTITAASLTILALAFSSGCVLAEEEYPLPAEVKQCYETAYSDRDLSACVELEAEFWDKKLNAYYTKALKRCASFAEDNFSEEEQSGIRKACESDLKNAQRNWIKFRDSMTKVHCKYPVNFGGTMQFLECSSAKAQIVKDQALRLKSLSD